MSSTQWQDVVPGQQRHEFFKRAVQNHPGIRLLSRPLFVLLVVVPNLLAITYYGLIASPVFMSTTSIAVSNPSENASSLVSILSGTSSDDSMEGGYILQEYLVSWAA